MRSLLKSMARLMFFDPAWQTAEDAAMDFLDQQ